MNQGHIQIYTGDGKGKTSASVGLGLRAAGHGLKVILIQFLKDGCSGELNMLKTFEDTFRVYNFAKTDKFVSQMSDDEFKSIADALKEELDVLNGILIDGSCDVLILDEIFAVLHAGLMSVGQIVDIMNRKPEQMELVLTGRGAPAEIMGKADLVTEMKAVKHYVSKGVKARQGIEF